jgi:RHS repeat-associated protein
MEESNMRTLIRWLAVMALVATLSAQQVDNIGDVVVSMNARIIWGANTTGVGNATIACYALSSTQPESNCKVVTGRGTGYPAYTMTQRLNTRFVPGVTYYVSVTVDNGYQPDYSNTGAPGFDLYVSAPTGYIIEQKMSTDQYFVGTEHQSGQLNVVARTTTVAVMVRIRAIQDPGLRAGMATAFNVDRILWQLSLGSLPNGNSAGCLTFANLVGSTDLAGMFTRQKLFSDVGSSDVVQLMDLNDSNTYRQIIAPQVCVDIVGQLSSGTVELKCYNSTQRSAQVNANTGYYDFSGDPYAWYKVIPQGSDPGGIVIECDHRDLNPTTKMGPVVRTLRTTLTRTGASPNFTVTATPWFDTSQSALSKVVKARVDTTETVKVQDAANIVALVEVRTYSRVALGEEVYQQVTGTSNPVTTTFSYYDAGYEQTLSFGKPKLVTNTTTGAWQGFDYDAQGHVAHTYGPFGSSPAVPSSLPPASGLAAAQTYSTDPFGQYTRPAGTTTTINGKTRSQNAIVYSSETPFSAYTDHPSLRIAVATRTDTTDNAGHAMSTVTKFFDEAVGPGINPSGVSRRDDFFRGLVFSVKQPNGTKASYAYQLGTWDGTTFSPTPNSGMDFVDGARASRTVVIMGSASTGTVCNSYNGLPIDAVYLVDGKSTMLVTIRDQAAKIVTVETYAWAPMTAGGQSSWNRVSWTTFTYNLSNQLTSRTANSGGTYSATYSGERMVSETNESGLTVNYAYDAIDRVDTATQAAAAPLTALPTKYTYDASGAVLSKTVGYGLSESLAYSSAYDDSGRVITQLEPGPNGSPLTTSYLYTYSQGSRAVKVSLPTGGDRTETYNLDESLASVTGSAVVAAAYTYNEPGTDGLMETDVAIAGSGTRMLKQWTDWVGRGVKRSRPGFAGGAAFIEQANYGQVTGLLLSTSRSGFGDTQFQYDALGQVIRSGLHVNGSAQATTVDGTVPVPAPAANDRITDSDQYFEYSSGTWWLTKSTSAYPSLGNSTSIPTVTTRTRLTGFSGTLQSEVLTTDVNQMVTDTAVNVSRSTATITKSTTVKDRNGSAVLSGASEIAVNGLVTSVTGFDGITYGTGYDSLWRKSTSTDPRTGTITTYYKTGSTYVSRIWGPIDATGTFNNIVQYDYDVANRINTETNVAAKHRYVEFDRRGNVVHEWGDTTYPVEYLYDSFGQRYEMHTYQNGTWTAGSWPGGTISGSTVWTYDEGSGLISAKSDTANKSVSFTYNVRGQVATRAWARHVDGDALKPLLTTTYTYDPNTGELTNVTYNDNLTANPTPSVAYAYTRAGLISTVTDGTGMRTFNYGEGSASPVSNALELDSISLPAFYGTRVLTRKYDGAYRPAGFTLGTATNRTADLSQTYAYNSGGQFYTITAASAVDGARTFTYSYNIGGLVSGLGVSGSGFGVARQYEPNRNLLTRIAATLNTTTTLTQYDYTYDPLGRRATAQQRSSSAGAFGDFATSADSSGSTYYRYAYNDRNELTDAADYSGLNPSSTSSPQLSDRHFAYTYDSSGNRRTGKRTGDAGTADVFTVNNLNQVTNVYNVYARAAGTVSETTTSVNVSGGNLGWVAGRQGRYWAADAQLASGNPPTSSAAAIALTVTATKAGGAPGGNDLVRTDTSKAILFPGTQALSYDEDGNLIGDGLWTYKYDAENRLVSMTSISISGFPTRYLDCAYDYLGRRVFKHSNNATTGAQSWRRYLYDGDNLVAEFDVPSGTGTPTLVRSYAWGLDLVGSLTASGGVGGLMQVTDHRAGAVASYFPTFDGNGNVASLVRVADGVTVAAYEYSPFGESLRAWVKGDLPALVQATLVDQPFRFSTKFTDTESGLVYYGARYYSPALGRFINRDPIEEAGGLNLYGFCGNDGVNRWDYLGNGFLSDLWNSTVGALGKGLKRLERWTRHHTPGAMLLNTAAALFAPWALPVTLPLDIASEARQAWHFAQQNPQVAAAIAAIATWYIGGWGAAAMGFEYGSATNLVIAGASSGFAGGFVGARASGADLRTSFRAGYQGAAWGGGLAFVGSQIGVKPTTKFAWRDAASQFVNTEARYEVGRFAENRLGISGWEFNAYLTAASFIGNGVFGNRIKQGVDEKTGTKFKWISGILSRNLGSAAITNRTANAVFGLPFDAVDIVLGYEGLPTATGWEIIGDKSLQSEILKSHSLGTLDMKNQTLLGILKNGSMFSLPFGNVAPAGVSVTLGTNDPVNGFVLGRWLNPWAATTTLDSQFLGMGHTNYPGTGFP